MLTILTIVIMIGVALAVKRHGRTVATSRVNASCGRKSVSMQKSRPKRPLPLSFTQTLVLATMTHLSRVEKFVKRFPLIQGRDCRDSFWMTKDVQRPLP